MWTADDVAKLCYERFDELPKRGKPEPGREWTLLAAVVKLTQADCGTGSTVEKEVVSLGTGTKCIGRTAMSPKGDVLNDSHAEVITRRGCIRYLTEQLSRALGGQDSVFCPSDQQEGQWKLRPGVSFLFFTSHTPCGDASIIPMTDSQSQPCPPVWSEETPEGANEVAAEGGTLKRAGEESRDGRTNKIARSERQEEAGPEGGRDSRQLDSTTEHCVSESPRLEDQSDADRPCSAAATSHVPDVHRTGAKCVPGGPADPLRPGAGYHHTGVLRVKPGRGEPTLSLSCSDKLARWGLLGFQGALLSHYLQGALYFSAVVVGKCSYSQEAMERALVSRGRHVSDLPACFSVRPPELLQSSLEFACSQAQTEFQHQAAQGRVSPCGAAISWCNVSDRPLDVTANGYKHGVTKKALGTVKARSLLCKAQLFQSFLALVSATDPARLPRSLRGTALRTYWDYKQAARSYQQAWQQLRDQSFCLWPRSDRNLLLFSSDAPEVPSNRTGPPGPLGPPAVPV